MSRTLTTTLALGLLVTLAASPAAQEAAMSTEAAARALVPLLSGVRERIETTRWTLSQGSLPPSPFTGRQSQIVALTLGRRPVELDPKTRAAMEQLQGWDVGTPGPAAVLFDHWLTALKLRGAGLKTPPSACDSTCAVELFTNPGEAFGSSPREREALRDQLLYEALLVAIEEAQPR